MLSVFQQSNALEQDFTCAEKFKLVRNEGDTTQIYLSFLLDAVQTAPNTTDTERSGMSVASYLLLVQKLDNRDKVIPII